MNKSTLNLINDLDDAPVAEDNRYWDEKYVRQLKDLKDIETGKYTPEDYFVFDKEEMTKIKETIEEWLI